MVTLKDYEGGPTAWCPGCGNFGILTAIKNALVQLAKEPSEVLIVSGIGQSGKLPQYMRCNTLNGLHGRTLPAATGAKIANHELMVLAVAGDGDCYGEGGNHLLHAIRRNIDVTMIVCNNQIYGLTKGQASPTSDEGFVTKVQPQGVILEPLNPMALGVAMDANFVARSFAGDIVHMTEMLVKAIDHKGFSLLDILQPCVSFNKKNTYKWYRERIYRLDEDYNPRDRLKAFEKALEWGDRIPIGPIYMNERTSFEEHLPALKKGPLVRHDIDLARFDVLFDDFM